MTLWLNDLAASELESLVHSLDLPRFRARQLYQWVFQKGVRDLDEMTNLPKALRQSLREAGYAVGPAAIDRVERSVDGTEKLAIRFADGAVVETVLLHMGGGKYTQCLSSQVGCAMGCAFCFTATLGFQRNLSSGEIFDQVLLARAHLAREAAGDASQRITNFVYMGMGEPLANLQNVLRSMDPLFSPDGLGYSSHRVTISTCGLVPQIKALAEAHRGVHLAISLHATTDEARSALMPVNRRYGLQALMAALREWPLEPQRRITIEYVLLRGVNDSLDDAKRLASLLKGLQVRVNLLPFNAFQNAPFEPPEDAQVLKFQKKIEDAGIWVTVRTRRGDDIHAACGQLGKHGDASDDSGDDEAVGCAADFLSGDSCER